MVNAMTTLAPLAALVLALASGAAQDAPRTYTVARGSTLGYRLVHKLHAVDAVSHAVEGKARVLPGGEVQVAVRARVDSFDSGNGNRDAHMREVTEAARYPYVTLKAAGAGAALAAAPEALDLTLRGELTFHGRTRPVEVPVKVTFGEDGRATVDATFPVSLEAYEVERPSLLFVKVDDRIDVTAKLALEMER
jgi:polyisoprenoid-binding protein YceI